MSTNDKIEINSTLNSKDYRGFLKKQFFGKYFLLYFILIPIILLILIEMILIIVGLYYGFNYEIIGWIIILPAVDIIVLIIYVIVTPIVVRVNWKAVSILPLTQKFTFQENGITIDAIYEKHRFRWTDVTKVTLYRDYLLQLSIDKVVVYFIPSNAFKDDTLERLFKLFQIYLEQDKIKIRKKGLMSTSLK